MLNNLQFLNLTHHGLQVDHLAVQECNNPIHHVQAFSKSFNKTHDKQPTDQTNHYNNQINGARKQVLAQKLMLQSRPIKKFQIEDQTLF